jgi:hypothetical protein
MAVDVEKHFLDITTRELPAHAESHVRRESGDLCLYVDWKLGNDPERPNKRSKKIKICISQAALDDYVDGDDQNRESADVKFQQVIAAQLAVFQPDHNVPAHVPVPVEQWTITTQMINA